MHQERLQMTEYISEPLPSFQDRFPVDKAAELSNLAHILRRKPLPFDILPKTKIVVEEINTLSLFLKEADGAIWHDEADSLYIRAMDIKEIDRR